MQAPTHSGGHPRHTFTKKLESICKKLDFKDHDLLESVCFTGRKHIFDITITHLWVVGSYAKGASHCGDLDLIVQTRFKGRRDARSSTVRRHFLGSPAGVTIYFGDLKENSSGLEFKDATLIWSGPGCDWSKRLASIVVNPEYKRDERKADKLPLDMKDFADLDVRDMEDLVDLGEKRAIEWEVVEIDKGMLKPIHPDRELKTDTSIRLHTESWGEKLRGLVPAAQRIVRSRDAGYAKSTVDVPSLERAILIGDRRVLMGYLRIYASEVISYFPWEEIVLIPFKRRQVPHVAWIIRKGPNYSKVKVKPREWQ